MSSTTKGQYCSPSSTNGGSCYTKAQLKRMISSYNRRNGSKISTRGSHAQMWANLDEKMRGACNSEYCWMKKLGQDYTNSFRPKHPSDNMHEWLSTSDIYKVLKQYEKVHPGFVFLGPYPIDFCEIGESEICNINLWLSKQEGVKKIGVVFNTDPSTKSGQHWVSMFIDISAPNQSDWEVGYFDSYGRAQAPIQIKKLISNLKKQIPSINVKMNCTDEMCTVTKQHQRGDSECGIYAIYFITERLKGRSWEDLVVNNMIMDDMMTQHRSIFFRPNAYE